MSIRAESPPAIDTPVLTGVFDDIALGAQSTRYIPGVDDVRASAARLRAALAPVPGQETVEFGGGGSWITQSEGRSFRLHVSPGTIALGSIDTNKAEKSVARAIDAHYSLVDLAAIWDDPITGEKDVSAFGKTWVDTDTGELVSREPAPRSEVLEWSKRSRMRMVRALAELDYSDWDYRLGDSAMVTLTYPGAWEKVAPNGRTVKKHFRALQRRWVRAIGDESWRVLWKLEFQRRGAPHLHFLARVPAVVTWSGGYDPRHGYGLFETSFESWLSWNWADIVGADHESGEWGRHYAAGTGVDFGGIKVSDPRRIALYFLGHSMKNNDGKEYQHRVPELWQAPGDGPGRFWGYSGFEKAVITLDVGLNDFYALARELRKLSRARDWKTSLVRARGIASETGARVSALGHGVKKRKTRSLGGGGSVLGGWVLLNDALPVVGSYSDWLRSRDDSLAGWFTPELLVSRLGSRKRFRPGLGLLVGTPGAYRAGA